MKARRGVALIAGLWLVIAIATVAAIFSLEARERREVGLAASDRGAARAAARGAMALMQAKLDQALRVGPTQTGQIANLRASDPWLDADSVFSGTQMIDSIPVNVTARDLGEQINVNSATEDELRNLFSFVLKDYQIADREAQCIMDWIDADSIPRPNGAEADQYIKDELLALPTNAPFRDLADLLNVEGMTPEIYAKISPYLRVRGSALVNLNTAPEAVLRALPGMSDQIVARVLAYRTQGRRITSVNQVMPVAPAAIARGRGGRGGAVAGFQGDTILQSAIASRVSVNTQQIEFTIVARQTPVARPSRISVIISRNGTTAVIPSNGYHEW